MGRSMAVRIFPICTASIWPVHLQQADTYLLCTEAWKTGAVIVPTYPEVVYNKLGPQADSRLLAFSSVHDVPAGIGAATAETLSVRANFWNMLDATCYIMPSWWSADDGVSFYTGCSLGVFVGDFRNVFTTMAPK